MFVTITSIRLKSLWLFFNLSWHGLKISRQIKTHEGFLKMKSTGFGYHHYTCSAWRTEADMKNFMRKGAHLKAMKVSAHLATEIRTYTYETNQLPTWKDAKRLLITSGKIVTYPAKL